MYSLSFASYFISLFGFGNEKVIALIVTTLFFLINIVGVDIMAKFQNLIVTMLCIALGLFAVVGLKYVQLISDKRIFNRRDRRTLPGRRTFNLRSRRKYRSCKPVC